MNGADALERYHGIVTADTMAGRLGASVGKVRRAITALQILPVAVFGKVPLYTTMDMNKVRDSFKQEPPTWAGERSPSVRRHAGR